MKEFWNTAKTKIIDRVRSGYGMDELSIALSVTGFVLLFIALFTGLDVLNFLSLALMLLAVYRCYSKNTIQRIKERTFFLHLIAKPKAWFEFARKRWTGRKTTRYFKCEGCGKTLSVPIGKGKIRTTCPNCHAQSIRHT